MNHLRFSSSGQETLAGPANPAAWLQQQSRQQVVALYVGALLLTAITVSQNFTNYGSLVPQLEQDLHTNATGLGLFSLLLYGMIGVTYLLGGLLTDHFGPGRVLVTSLLIVGLGNCLLGLFSSLTWALACRALIGCGAGTAIVAASQTAASLGRYAAVYQGLFGGGMQLGAALGTFLSPRMMIENKWENSFLLWGCLTIVAALSWSLLAPTSKRRIPSLPTGHGAGRRVRVLAVLGAVHLGTLGLGQAMAPWLPLYFIVSQGIPSDQAILLGALTLLLGMGIRPLGGWLLTRQTSASSLLLVGTALVTSGLSLLIGAGRASFLWLAVVGLVLFSIGTTLPYATVFQMASSEGKQTRWGPATGQGIVSLLSSPGSAGGPVLVGWLVSRGGEAGFTVGFGCLALVGLFSLLVAACTPALFAQLATPLPGSHVTPREEALQ